MDPIKNPRCPKAPEIFLEIVKQTQNFTKKRNLEFIRKVSLQRSAFSYSADSADFYSAAPAYSDLAYCSAADFCYS